MRKPAIYIITNKKNGVLYTGVTADLANRIFKHKNGLSGFSSKYHCNKLVYCEFYDSIEDAIRREKQIKSGSRSNKIRLIESMNPHWEDLFDRINQ